MELDKDNANPTILNPSDLPSRRSDSTAKRRDDGGTGLFDDVIPRYSHHHHHLFDDASVSATDSDDDDDDYAPEAIDEQEVYGTPTCLPDGHPPSLLLDAG